MSPSSEPREGSRRDPEDYTTLKPEDESKARPIESETSPPAGQILSPTDELPKDKEAAQESDGEEGEYEPVRIPSNDEKDGETNENTSHHESIHPAAHIDNDPSGHEEEEEEGEEELAREQHYTQHQTPTRPIGYMDYLRHPGSRPASQHGKPGGSAGMTSMGTGTSLAELQNAIGGGLGHDEDPDCARTPFSVD